MYLDWPIFDLLIVGDPLHKFTNLVESLLEHSENEKENLTSEDKRKFIDLLIIINLLLANGINYSSLALLHSEISRLKEEPSQLMQKIPTKLIVKLLEMLHQLIKEGVKATLPTGGPPLSAKSEVRQLMLSITHSSNREEQLWSTH